MQVRHVTIRRFRGIRELDWDVRVPVACLIGPGDSTKSTILDAIELALSPRWILPLSDTDFYMEDVSQPLEITVTVGQLPQEFLSDDKFGLVLRGWNQASGLRDEPADEDEHVLSVQFQVDHSLEPVWTVVNDRIPAGRTISWRDRELLGMVRLGAEVDRHLSWGRGSALIRLTGGQVNAPNILTEANREARRLVGTADTTALKTAAQKTQTAAERFGVKPLADYQPALDTKATVGGAGALSIYEGSVPVRMRGLGSRRLVALAAQSLSVAHGAIVLIDDVEMALEPHRIRHLLVTLQQAIKAQPGGEELAIGQVLMTTHSHTVITTLSANEQFVVRSTDGKTDVRSLAPDLQDTIRRSPEAFLGRKVIVCEGRTELGLCWALERSWTASHGGLPLAHVGTVPIDGGGGTAAQTAVNLADLGYAVALFIDSDVEPNPSLEVLQSRGIAVIQWAGQVNTEQRIADDLSWEDFKKMVRLAMEFRTEEGVRDAVHTQLGASPSQVGPDPDEWVGKGHSPEVIRKAFAMASVGAKPRWYKQLDRAQALGEIVASALPAIQGTDLARKLDALEQWAYA